MEKGWRTRYRKLHRNWSLISCKIWIYSWVMRSSLFLLQPNSNKIIKIIQVKYLLDNEFPSTSIEMIYIVCHTIGNTNDHTIANITNHTIYWRVGAIGLFPSLVSVIAGNWKIPTIRKQRWELKNKTYFGRKPDVLVGQWLWIQIDLKFNKWNPRNLFWLQLIFLFLLKRLM